ncbi:MAG: hypothetical protein AABZ60_08710, partial [Planctomycetota bacterium]
KPEAKILKPEEKILRPEAKILKPEAKISKLEEEEEDDDEDGPISLLSEEDERDFPDMNSLVSSLDKGGEGKLREFRRRGPVSPQNQPGGIVRAYSSEYLEEQSNKQPLAPTPIRTNNSEDLEEPSNKQPLLPIPPKEEQPPQKSFSRDFRNRRDDRGRRDQERNRKEDRYSSSDKGALKSSSDTISSTTTSSSSSSSSSRDRNSFSDRYKSSGNLPAKEGTPSEISTPSTQPEKKFSREERQSVRVLPTTLPSPLLTSDLNHADSRQWLLILLFLILVVLILNFVHPFLPQENYRNQFRIAEQCIKYEDWTRAKEMLEMAIRSEPSYTKARLALAYIHLRELEEGNSLASIYQEIRLIRNILNDKFKGQLVNDSPESIEGKFLQLVYTRLDSQWKRNLIDFSKIDEDLNFKILSELWGTEAVRWQKTVQNIQSVFQALKSYALIKKVLPKDLESLKEQNPETKQPFLEETQLSDGWKKPFDFKTELWKEDSPETKKQEHKMVITSFGAHRQADNKTLSGWTQDISKTDYLTLIK